MEPTTIAIIGIVVFMVLIMMGMNIGMAMFLVGFVGYAAVVNVPAALAQLRSDPITQASNYSMVVLPLFILMGNFAYRAGMSKSLYDAANKWLSRVPGNLAAASVAACAGFGAICGSNAATCATMGTIAIPEMREKKYADTLATGSVAMGGTLGIMIPPSTPMVLYCIMAEASIGAQFSAGVIPGIMLAILSILTIVLIVKLDPSKAPAPWKCSWKERVSSLKGLIGVVFLFGVVLGGMFAGYFSITQAASVGAFLAFVLMLIADRGFNRANFFGAMKDTVLTFSMTFLMICGASTFCKFLAVTQLPMNLARTISGMNVSPYVIVAIITVIYIILGAMMDEVPMIMLTVPIFLPVMEALGFHPIWFGIYIILVMELGAIAPPVGLNCFIIAGITKDIPLARIYKGILPFVVTILVAIVFITAFPDVVLVLPRLFYPSSV